MSKALAGRSPAVPAFVGAMRMAGLVCALAAAVPAARAQYAGGAAPAVPGIINMSLMEALVAVRRPELAGVFAFVPEGQATLAMADLLLRDRDALKRFLKKGEKDAAELKMINQWDKEVCLHMVAATADGGAPPGIEPLPKSLLDRVSRLSLANGVPLELVTQSRRKGAK